MMSTRETDAADYSPAVTAIPASCAGLRLDAAMARLFPAHSRSRWQAWMKEGRVTLDDAPADASRKVLGGEMVRVGALPPPTETNVTAEAIVAAAEMDTMTGVDLAYAMSEHATLSDVPHASAIS